MDIQLSLAPEQDKEIIWRMLELYQHDLSIYSRADLNEKGEFEYPYFKQYWSESGKHPYIIRCFDKLAGFALVNMHHFLPDSEFSMAEFFILKRYRRQGIGGKSAVKLFNQYPGIWEVRVLPDNKPAFSFWKLLIENYTDGAYKEILEGFQEWKGPIFQFNSKKGGKS